MSFSLDAATTSVEVLEESVTKTESAFDRLAGQFKSLPGKFGELVSNFAGHVDNFMGLGGKLTSLLNPIKFLVDKFLTLGTEMAKNSTEFIGLTNAISTVSKSFDIFIKQIITAVTNIPGVSTALGYIKSGVVYVTDAINSLAGAFRSGLAFELLSIEAKLWVDTLKGGVATIAGAFTNAFTYIGGLVRDVFAFFGLELKSSQSLFETFKNYLVSGFYFVLDAILNLPINLKTVIGIMIAEGDKFRINLVKSFDLMILNIKTGWENMGFAIGSVARNVQLFFAKAIDGLINLLADGVRMIASSLAGVPLFEDVSKQLSAAATSLSGFATNTDSVKAAMQLANEEHNKTLAGYQAERQQIEQTAQARLNSADQYVENLLREREAVLATRQAERDAAYGKYSGDQAALPGSEETPMLTQGEQPLLGTEGDGQVTDESLEETKALQDEMRQNYFAKEQEQVMKHYREKEALLKNHLKAYEKLQIDSAKYMAAFDKMSTRDKVTTVLGGLQQLTDGSKDKSKKMFEINKALALANAVVSLPDAVMQSFRNGGGYPWGLIPAGLMLATGVKQIQAIKSSKFGGGAGTNPALAGGGGGAVPVGPAAISSSATTPVVEDDVVTDEQGATIGASASSGATTINVTGVITQEIVDELLIPAIQEAVDKRDVILIRNGTQNAAELGIS